MGIDPTPTKSVQLSESTLRMLAGLDEPKPDRPNPKRTRATSTPAVRGPRPARVPDGMCGNGLHKMEGDNVRIGRRSGGRVTRECRACILNRTRSRRENQPRVTEPPASVPCIDCGGMIGVRVNGYSGWALAGEGGRCEVCADRPKAEKIIADHKLLPPEEQSKRTRRTALMRARRMLERVLDGGRAFHPGAPHGTSYAYSEWRCRCEKCSEARGVINQTYRDRQAMS
ncbi:hypothetical protein ACWDTG_06880 [Rhodococcus zopfii]